MNNKDINKLAAALSCRSSPEIVTNEKRKDITKIEYGPCPHCNYDGLHGDNCDECDSIVIDISDEPIARKLAIELVNKLIRDHPELFQ